MILRARSGYGICQKYKCRASALPKSLPFSRQHPPGVRLQHDQARSGAPKAADVNPTARNYPQTQQHGSRHGPSLPLEEEPTGKPVKWFKVGRGQVSFQPLGRLYGVRGHQQREDAVELDIKNSGKPSEVIVLRDASVRAVPSIIEDAETPERVDLLAELDAERGLISRAEVKENIELLMPKDGTKLRSLAELGEIQEHLLKGFTVAQLVDYIHSFDAQISTARIRDDGQHKAESLGFIRGKITWMAGNSGPGEVFEENNHRGYGSEWSTHKKQLVLLILRQCWGLEALEITETIGTMEIKLGPTEMALLTSGYTSPLQRMRKELFLSPKEKIEAFQSEGILSIIASKEKCETVSDQILTFLQNVHHQEVSLDVLLSNQQQETTVCEAWKENVLDELARLTETEIKWLPKSNKTKLCISYINKSPGTNLSTAADVAQRLLLTSSDAADRTVTNYGYTDSSPPFLATKYHSTDGMSWRNGLRSWVRWTCPMPKNPLGAIDDNLPKTEIFNLESENHPDLSTDLDDLHDQPAEWPSGINESEVEQQDSLHDVSEDVWDQNFVTSTSAIVGHVLQAVPTAQEAAMTTSQPPVAERAIFEAAKVNLSRFISTMAQPLSSPPASLVMRFLPSPWAAQGSAVLAKFPPMEMIFAVDAKTKVPTLKKLVAVVDSDASDIMLLNSSLDLRFQQQRTACLRTSNSQQLPQIKDFLDASKLNIKYEQLETPSGLSLPVSAHLCRFDASQHPSDLANEYFDVDYLFAGLEYRTSIAFNFEDWELRYTNIEGGQADGRRTQLSLLPHRLPKGTSKELDGSMTSAENQTEQYINAAYHLIDRLDSLSNPEITQTLNNNLETTIKSLHQSQDSDFQLLKWPISFQEQL